LDGKRKVMGGIAFLFFFISFTPAPFPQLAEEIKKALPWF